MVYLNEDPENLLREYMVSILAFGFYCTFSPETENVIVILVVFDKSITQKNKISCRLGVDTQNFLAGSSLVSWIQT